MVTVFPEELLPGDLLACWGADWTSRAISWGTASLVSPPGLRVAPSHVAVVCDMLRGGTGGPLWVESTTMCGRPCVFRGRPVDGCQAHLPGDRVGDYLDAGGRVEVYRLVQIDRLDSAERERLRSILLDEFVAPGVRYDWGGAVLSGRRLRTLPRVIGADLEQLFCSEMVAATLQRLCRMNRRNPSWYSPGRLLRELVWQGTYRRYGEAAVRDWQSPVIPMAEAA